jgi:hypothetical protein
MTTITYIPTDLINLIGEFANMDIKLTYYKKKPDKIQKVKRTERCCVCNQKKVGKRRGKYRLVCNYNLSCELRQRVWEKKNDPSYIYDFGPSGDKDWIKIPNRFSYSQYSGQ